MVSRIAQRRHREEQHEERFGARGAELTMALTAALSWRHIYVPAEDGPVQRSPNPVWWTGAMRMLVKPPTHPRLA